MNTTLIKCVFCGKDLTLPDPYYGLNTFKVTHGDYTVDVLVMKNNRDESGKVTQALTQTICLPCLKEFIQKAEDKR
jgi:hypothetical protein